MATGALALLSLVSTIASRLASGMTSLLHWLLRRFSSRCRRQVGRPAADRAVLVTCCDDECGYGRALVCHLDQLGIVVFAGCSSESALEQIRQSASPGLKPFLLDVTDPESVRRAVEFIQRGLGPSTVLWGVVNTPVTVRPAGLPAEMHTIDDDYRPLFETNVFGMAAVTMSLMPMLISSRGRVVNTGCLTGLVAIPGNISYVACESAIVAWSEALRREKANVGLTVSTVVPGAFRTTDNDIETIWAQLKGKWTKLPTDTKKQYDLEYLIKAGQAAWETNKTLSPDLGPVVAAFEDALFSARPRRVYHVGGDVRLAAVLSSLTRRCQDFLLPFVFYYPRTPAAVGDLEKSGSSA